MTNITPSVNSRIGILGTENWDIRDREKSMIIMRIIK